jgi:hypothetical protein
MTAGVNHWISETMRKYNTAKIFTEWPLSSPDTDVIDPSRCRPFLEFQCHARGSCIPASALCNGVSECDDGSDEDHEFCDNVADRKELQDRCNDYNKMIDVVNEKCYDSLVQLVAWTNYLGMLKGFVAQLHLDSTIILCKRVVICVEETAHRLKQELVELSPCKSIDTDPTWMHLIMCTGQLPSFKEVFEDRGLVRNEYLAERTARGIPPCPASHLQTSPRKPSPWKPKKFREKIFTLF